MTKERYRELETNIQLQLTPEELVEGWHFCLEWDDMLIHKSWKEAEYCSCRGLP